MVSIAPVLLSDCKPGAWYLIATCPHCKTTQAILRDPSDGKAVLHAIYSHRCDVCGIVTDFAPEDIKRYQHPPSAETK